MSAGTGTLRGSQAGSHSSLEREDIDLAERSAIEYECASGHPTVLWYAAEAERIPDRVSCRRCRREAVAITPDERVNPSPTDGSSAFRPFKTPVEYLHDRRTMPELEALLADAIGRLRGQGFTFGRTGGAAEWVGPPVVPAPRRVAHSRSAAR
jgi:hypothetical protein